MGYAENPSAFKVQAVPSLGARSMSVPRLADFAYSDSASLISPVVLRGSFRVLEGLMVALVGSFIAKAYLTEADLASNAPYWGACAAIGLATVTALELFGLYSMKALSSVLASGPKVVLGWSLGFSALVMAVFFAKMGEEFSRVWLAAWFAAGTISLISGRFLVSALLAHLARKGRLYRRAAIYGYSAVTRELIAQLEGDLSSDIRICGIFDDRSAAIREEAAASQSRVEENGLPAMIAGYPRLGGLSDLVAFGRKTRLDLVIVALPFTAEDRVLGLMKNLSVLPAEIKLPAGATKLRFTPGTYSHVGAVAMIDLYDKPIADWGSGFQMALRQDRGYACDRLPVSDHAGDCACREADEPWPCVVPAEALRLQ